MLSRQNGETLRFKLCEGEENKRYVTQRWFHWDLVTSLNADVFTSAPKPLTNKLCALGENTAGGWRSDGSSLLPPCSACVLVGL